MNPATTFTFFRLAKIEPIDAIFYAAAQFAGAVTGVYVASIALGGWLSHPEVGYVVTLPGRYGYRWAFAAEFAITFLLMSVILRISNIPKLNRYTGLAAGLLVMIYISIEAPVSPPSKVQILKQAFRPSLSVFRSLQHVYAQVIDDTTGRTLVSASTLDAKLREEIGKLEVQEQAKAIGRAVAERAKAARDFAHGVAILGPGPAPVLCWTLIPASCGDRLVHCRARRMVSGRLF